MSTRKYYLLSYMTRVILPVAGTFILFIFIFKFKKGAFFKPQESGRTIEGFCEVSDCLSPVTTDVNKPTDGCCQLLIQLLPQSLYHLLEMLLLIVKSIIVPLKQSLCTDVLMVEGQCIGFLMGWWGVRFLWSKRGIMRNTNH